MDEKEKNRKSFARGVLTGVLATAVVLLLVLGIRYIVVQRNGSFLSGRVTEKDVDVKLDQLSRLIDKYYLYDDKVDKDKLVEGIYSGYASALGDPYTVYYDKDATKELMESNEGEFSGIGAEMSQDTKTGTITITEVYEDSPAEKAGLMNNDVLVGVDDRSVSGQKLENVVSWLKGEKGTEVKITVSRDGNEQSFTVVRDNVEVHTVKHEMKDGNIGYIAVSEFDSVTYDQFKEALDDLEKQGMTGLVIDLRNNPGGNLTTVTDMLKLLLPKGTIVSTKDKNGNTEKITCDGTHEFKKPLAVLVNQNSASASEIFSGAVQDYGTGTIVGVTTYGKGVVQQIMDLGDGTALKLTIAEYYTPKGRSINGKGVTPDVEVEYQYDAGNPQADNQLEKALEIVRNKQ